MRFRKIILVAAVLVAIFLLYNWRSLWGLSLKYLIWQEDAFTGQKVEELQNALSRKGKSLGTVTRGHFYTMTDYPLKTNESGFVFDKSKEFDLIWASACNVGYVVVENGLQDGRVVKIFHVRPIEGP